MNSRELFDQWLVLRSSVAKPQTINGYRQQVTDLFTFMDERPIAELDQAMLAGWIKKRLQTNLDNPNSVRRTLITVNAFLKWCREEGHTKLDPLKGQPKVQAAEVCKVPFTWAEYQQTLDACREYEAQAKAYRVVADRLDHKGRAITFKKEPRFVQWSHFCIVAWNTGMRISDCALLRWEQVDFVSEVVLVQPHKMRYIRQTAAVPMEPELLAHLMSLDRSSEWVCPAFRLDYLHRRATLEHAFRGILDGIGLTRHSSHSFRHSMVSRLLNSGASTILVGQITGQSPMTVAKYAHITDTAKRDAMARARHHAEPASLTIVRETAA